MFKNLPGARGFVFPKYQPVAIHGDPIQASGQPNLSDISPEDMSSVATEDITSVATEEMSEGSGWAGELAKEKGAQARRRRPSPLLGDPGN